MSSPWLLSCRGTSHMVRADSQCVCLLPHRIYFAEQERVQTCCKPKGCLAVWLLCTSQGERQNENSRAYLVNVHMQSCLLNDCPWISSGLLTGCWVNSKEYCVEHRLIFCWLPMWIIKEPFQSIAPSVLLHGSHLLSVS